jgi:hypothetical protein
VRAGAFEMCMCTSGATSRRARVGGRLGTGAIACCAQALAHCGCSQQALRLIELAKDGVLKGYSDLSGVVLLLDFALQVRVSVCLRTRICVCVCVIGVRSQAADGLADRATLEKVCPYALLRQMFTGKCDRSDVC